MSARLRGIARETERAVAEGVYRAPDGHAVEIGAAVEAARQATTLYGPEPVPVPPFEPAPTRFEVTGESSLAAARRLTGPGAPDPVAVLNFASARNPAAATSTAPRHRRRPCAARPRCTPACCGRPASTTITAPTGTRSTPTG